jgi:hypothetical protein
MKTTNIAKTGRRTLGTVSRSTRGGVRGVIEPFGLYTAGIRLD